MSHEERRRTTVRSTHPAASDRIVRAAVRALGRVAPHLAAGIALRLFSRPPRRAWPDALSAIPGARAITAQVRGSAVRAWHWGEGAPVFLVHGWGGYGGQLAAFVRPLLDAGLAVVGFDGPAHGASGGRSTSLPGFADAIAALAEQAGAPRGAIAHSFGAAATTLALRRGLPVAAQGFRAVYVAPFVDPVRYFDLFVRSLGLTARLTSSMRARAETSYGVKWDEIDLVSRSRDRHEPLLVLHDRDDRALPLRDSESLVAQWPGARLVVTSGLGHNRILADPAAVATAVSFMTDGAAAAAAR